MLNKVKEVTGLDVISKYLARTKWWRKILDVLLVCLIMIVYGYSTGKIALPAFSIKPHTVEDSLERTRHAQKILDTYQITTKHSFVGHFIFHNGQSSLNGSFAFIKYSLMEHSRNYGVAVNVLRWKDIPIQVNIDMVLTLKSNKCYKKDITLDDVQYMDYQDLVTNHIIACPIFDRNNRLASFVLVGSTKEIDEQSVIILSKEVSALQTYK